MAAEDRMMKLAQRLDETDHPDLADRMTKVALNLKPIRGFYDDAIRGFDNWRRGGRMFQTIDPSLKGVNQARIADELRNLPMGMLERGNPQEIFNHIQRQSIAAMTDYNRRAPWDYSRAWHAINRPRKGEIPVEKLQRLLEPNWRPTPGAWGQYGPTAVPAVAGVLGGAALWEGLDRDRLPEPNPQI